MDSETRRHIVPAALSTQRGAALAEFYVLTFVMVPLMFVIPMIGKLIDARQTTIQAARYASWEATIAAPGSARRPAQVAARFFGTTDDALISDPAQIGTHTLWGEYEQNPDSWPGRTAITLDKTAVTVEDWSLDRSGHADLAVAGTVGDAIEAAGNALGSVAGGEWRIGETALTRSAIGVDVKINGWFAELGVSCRDGYATCMGESSTILVDGWSAADDAQAKKRVRALVPAGALEPVGKFVSLIGAFPIFEELKKTERMFGHVDMGPLPEHASRGLETYQESER